jgi:hypothetical protein
MARILEMPTLSRSRILVLAAIMATVSAGACDSNPNTPAPVTAAPIIADPYLNLPPQSPDFLVRRVLEGAVGAVYFRSDFAALEAMAKYYRDTEAKTPAGAWKLSLFYDALAVEYDDQHPGDDYLLNAAEKKDLKWIAAFPDSPTPYAVYASQLIEHGWFFRGGGYADTVSDDGAKKFQDYLARAREFLEKHKSEMTSDPQWYVAMLKIALGQGWEKDQFEPLLKEGLDHFPFYYRIYLAGMELYLPNWGGNMDDLDLFVDDAVARTSSKEGTTLYARIYASGGHGLDNEDSRMQWPKLFNALEEMRQRYPDPKNDNKSAYFACAAGDKIWTAHMMPLVKTPPEYDIWQTQENIDRCRAWASDGKPPDGKSPLKEDAAAK